MIEQTIIGFLAGVAITLVFFGLEIDEIVYHYYNKYWGGKK